MGENRPMLAELVPFKWKQQDSSQRFAGDWVGGKAASSRRTPKMPKTADSQTARFCATKTKCGFVVAQKSLHLKLQWDGSERRDKNRDSVAAMKEPTLERPQVVA